MHNRVFFRADGNSKMGLGHVFRSLALAEMIREDFDCQFLIRNPLPEIKEHILTICSDIYELPDTQNDVSEARYINDYLLEPTDIIVLDGYHFETNYQILMKGKGCRIVCIDDIPQHHFVADAIINHTGGISSRQYSTEEMTRIFIGPEYALLRQPFITAATKKDFSNWEKAIFVCLGGADPENDTLKILQRLDNLNQTEKVYLVTGAAYKHQAALDNFRKRSALTIKQLSNLTAEEMVTVMKRCPSAICPPSTIAYEYLSIGGKLYLHQIADNQLLIKNYLLKNNLAFDIAEFPVSDSAMVLETIRQQEKLFNGENKKNILNIFQNLGYGYPMRTS